jgi:dihydrofolate reductase
LRFAICLISVNPLEEIDMGKVIVWNLVTLDGYFEGTKKWDLDFHMQAWGPELEALSREFGKKAEALVFGRVTYEGMKAYWTTAEDDTEVKAYINRFRRSSLRTRWKHRTGTTPASSRTLPANSRN